MHRREYFSSYLDRSQLDALREISRETRVPVAVLVRDAVDLYLVRRASMSPGDAAPASLARAAGAPDASPSSADAPSGQAAPRKRPSARASAARTEALLDDLEGVIEASTRLLRDDEEAAP